MIDECEGYSEAVAQHPAWRYLEAMEERNACGGWCVASTPLWTGALRGGQDSCVAVAAEIMYAKAQHATAQVVVYTLILIALTSIGLIVVGPDLRNRGIE